MLLCPSPTWNSPTQLEAARVESHKKCSFLQAISRTYQMSALFSSNQLTNKMSRLGAFKLKILQTPSSNVRILPSETMKLCKGVFQKGSERAGAKTIPTAQSELGMEISKLLALVHLEAWEAKHLKLLQADPHLPPSILTSSYMDLGIVTTICLNVLWSQTIPKALESCIRYAESQCCVCSLSKSCKVSRPLLGETGETFLPLQLSQVSVSLVSRWRHFLDRSIASAIALNPHHLSKFPHHGSTITSTDTWGTWSRRA